MKEKIKACFVMLSCLVCLSWTAMAQHQVSGKVTSAADNSPIAGVGVTVKGSNIGVATDESGNYTLEVPSGDVTLVFSFIGFATREVAVNNQTLINVSMEEDTEQLEQVVAIGYGTARRSDLTGSVGTINAADLVDRSPVSAVKALQGRIAGVEVLNNAAAPGSSARIRIRGINSINTGKEPLVVVDGIIGVDLNMVNPNDISSIEVLKDASATAIYGARGANGVLLVTTKRGIANSSQLTYSGFVSVGARQRSVPSLNAAQFMEVYHRAYDNAEKYDPTGFAQGKYTKFDPADFPLLFDASGNPLYDTNWEDEVYRTAVSNSHTLSLRGGSANTRYSFSMGYTGEQGIMINSWNNRFTGKVTLDSDVKPWLTVGGSVMGVRNKQHVIDDANGALNMPRLVTEMIPIVPVRYPDGTWSKNNDFYSSAEGDNPVRVARERGTDRITSQLYGDAYLNFKLAPGLELKTQFSVLLDDDKNNFYSGRELRNLSADQRGIATVGIENRTYWQSENYLTWNKQVGDHSITGLGGLSWSKDNYETLSVRGDNFLDDFFQWRNLPAAGTIAKGNIGSGINQSQLNSYFTRWNYSYKDKYLLTVTGRYDGSSKFGKNNKYAFFPSAGIAWRVSEENFMQGSPGISNLKVRLSYGHTGNQELGSYASLQFLNTANVLFANGLQTGLFRGSFGNPDLKWETTKQADLGVELGLWDDRLSLEVDLYHKRTDDLLLSAPLPWSTGLDGVTRNIGSVENKGIEVSISSLNISRGDFTWSTSLNWASNRNEIVQLANNNADIFPGPWFLGQTNILRVGQPIGTIWGKTRLGTWGTDEADEAAEYGVLPGDLKLADLNNDGTIDGEDESIIGRMYPKWVGNMTNELRYGQFDFSFDLRFSYGNDVINATKHSAEDRQTLTNSYATVLNAWTPENQNSMIAEVRAWGTYYTTNIDSWWVEDGSFLRLQNIVLGYNFPQQTLQRLSLQQLRVYVSAQNLFLATDYTGYDPEVETYGYSHAQGLDFYPYAKPRIINLGVNVTF